MNINLDKYFDTQKPSITVFGKTYPVDNDYKKVLAMQNMSDLKADEDGVRQFLATALVGGEQAADEIMAHNIPFPAFQQLQTAVVAAMTGQSMEAVEKASKKAMEGRFQQGAKKRV